MKRFTVIALALVMSFSMLTACSSSEEADTGGTTTGGTTTGGTTTGGTTGEETPNKGEPDDDPNYINTYPPEGEEEDGSEEEK